MSSAGGRSCVWGVQGGWAGRLTGGAAAWPPCRLRSPCPALQRQHLPAGLRWLEGLAARLLAQPGHGYCWSGCGAYRRRRRRRRRRPGSAGRGRLPAPPPHPGGGPCRPCRPACLPLGAGGWCGGLEHGLEPGPLCACVASVRARRAPRGGAPGMVATTRQQRSLMDGWYLLRESLLIRTLARSRASPCSCPMRCRLCAAVAAPAGGGAAQGLMSAFGPSAKLCSSRVPPLVKQVEIGPIRAERACYCPRASRPAVLELSLRTRIYVVSVYNTDTPRGRAGEV